MTVPLYIKNTSTQSNQMKTNLIGRTYLSKIANDMQKKSMECSYFSEGMGSAKSDRRHAMNRILGGHPPPRIKPLQQQRRGLSGFISGLFGR